MIRVRGHALSTQGLGPETTVLDAGAHRGEFSREMTERFTCRCYLVEANPELAEPLERSGSFAGVVGAALGAADGEASFFARSNPEAGSLFSDEACIAPCVPVQVKSLAAIQRELELSRIDVLKLDIEGAEFDFLRETPAELLTSIAQITVEFHDFLPAFAGRGMYEGVSRRLCQLGFVRICGAFRTHGDVLFLNRRSFDIGPLGAVGLASTARWKFKLGRSQ